MIYLTAIKRQQTVDAGQGEKLSARALKVLFVLIPPLRSSVLSSSYFSFQGFGKPARLPEESQDLWLSAASLTCRHAAAQEEEKRERRGEKTAGKQFYTSFKLQTLYMPSVSVVEGRGSLGLQDIPREVYKHVLMFPFIHSGVK